MSVLKRKPQRSLRTILIVWFLLFSVVPLAFVTGYSVIKYEKAIDNELLHRLDGNGREISVILADFKKGLEDKRDSYLDDNQFIYHLSTQDLTALRRKITLWLGSEYANQMSFFSRDGRMLLSAEKSSEGVQLTNPPANQAVYIAEANLTKLQGVTQYAFVDYSITKNVSLILLSKVFSSTGRHVGYIEQVIDLNEGFLSRLKSRMKLELILMRTNGQPVVGTHPDFYLYEASFFSDLFKPEANAFFELSVRSEPFGFIMYPIQWGNTDMYIALGASKGEAKAVLTNVNFAFYTVVGAVILLLIVTILMTSTTIIKPLQDLVEAIDQVQLSDRPVEIPIKSDTEIGLLTESFNQMARNVILARSDLRKKITELELANQELKDTQSKLVHSSKMVSLGQLVAGVAHELNNPIGFIYSNMTHLKDYGEKLIELIETAESDPQKLAELKEKYELEYIKQDLPKLISSCEDGARRTRDIVLGLRNFSRLEEAKLKEIDLHEAIDSTLNLLSGEIKNRIQVVKEYGSLPLVTCFASQINQVFMNILSNAVQAIEGSGNIWITTKLVPNNNSKELVSISIQDSGKGMTPQVVEKIFDPFFSTKGVGQGTGLGLSISYGIIQSHGGDIQVKSQLGIGTEFIITIPVHAEDHLKTVSG